MAISEQVRKDANKRVLGGKHYASDREATVIEDLNNREITGANGKVTLNQDQLLSETGKSEFRDTVEDNILDNQGIVSETQFDNFDSAVSSASQTTSSTSFVDVTAPTLTITLARDSKVLLFASVSGANVGVASGYNTLIRMALVKDAVTTEYSPDMYTPGVDYSGGVVYLTASAQRTVSLLSGSYTFKLRFRTTNASGDATLIYKTIGYLVLGK